MLFIFDISVVMLSQQDLPVYRCSNKPKLEESTEHLGQVQWATTCGAQNLGSTQRCPGGHPYVFWSKLRVSFLGTPVLRTGRLKEVPKNASWKQSWERGIVGIKGFQGNSPNSVQSAFSRLTCYRGTVPCSTLLQQSDNIPVASERQIQRFPAEHPIALQI